LIKEVWSASNTEIATKFLDYFPTLESIFDYQATIISKGTQSEVMRFNIEDTGFYIKRYFRTKGLRSHLGHSRLRMEIRNQQRFLRWGLNAAAVIAYGERYRFTHTLKGALVTLAVNNSSNLEDISRN
jgi:tRNA A-37 threonylcarbamoyl transferase component Bud32